MTSSRGHRLDAEFPGPLQQASRRAFLLFGEGYDYQVLCMCVYVHLEAFLPVWRKPLHSPLGDVPIKLLRGTTRDISREAANACLVVLGGGSACELQVRDTGVSRVHAHCFAVARGSLAPLMLHQYSSRCPAFSCPCQLCRGGCCALFWLKQFSTA